MHHRRAVPVCRGGRARKNDCCYLYFHLFIAGPWCLNYCGYGSTLLLWLPVANTYRDCGCAGSLLVYSDVRHFTVLGTQQLPLG